MVFLFVNAGFNGTITNDKFCMSRAGHLRLTWWHLSLRARQKGTQAVEYPSEKNTMECDLQEDTHEETAMDHPTSHGEVCRRSVSMGSELPVPCPMESSGSQGSTHGTFFSGEAT
jgi:hypothetical protein